MPKINMANIQSALGKVKDAAAPLQNKGHTENVPVDYIRLADRNVFNETDTDQSIHKENGLKGISLTTKGLEKLKERFPGRFNYVSEKSRTELSRRYRKQSFALTYCSLMNADIEFLPVN